MNNKEKLDTAIMLLKMAREQMNLEFSDFNQTRFKDEIKEARRLQADVIRGSHVNIWQELENNDRS